MLRKPIKVTEIVIGGHRYSVQYFEQQTLRGGQRFSCEVELTESDRVIVDDDSLAGLESKVERLAPATIYSRLLGGRPPVAA